MPTPKTAGRVGGFVELTPAFAVPIGHARLEPCDRLNRELEQLFLTRETQEYRNPAPSHNPQAEMFESRFDLFTWPEPCIQELRKFMLESVFRVAMAASKRRPKNLPACASTTTPGSISRAVPAISSHTITRWPHGRRCIA